MPCLILTGYPSSGKSTLAELFRERALLLGQQRNDASAGDDTHNDKKTKTKNTIEHVVIVSESTACPDQSTSACYVDSQAEKATRSALKAAFDRAVGAAASDSKTLIILDSMNYIKGFRYELYCISKAAKDRHAVVWVMNDVAVSKEWNEKRRRQKQQQQQQEETTTTNNETSSSSTTSRAAEDFYSNEQMEELILRYEPPDARNRWDKPLYRVDMRPSPVSSSSNQQTASGDQPSSGAAAVGNGGGQGLAMETLERSVYNMHDLSDAIHLQKETNINTASIKKSSTSTMGGFKRAKSKAAPVATSTSAPTNEGEKHDESSVVKPSTSSAKPQSQTASPESETSTSLSLEERVDAILDSFLNHVQPLQQSFSTQEQLASSDANVLQKVDGITQQVCQAIVHAQNKTTVGSAGGKLAIDVPQLHQGEERLWLHCHRLPLSWTQLRRLRKNYVQWVKSNPPQDTTQRGIAQSFLQYIEAAQQ